MNMNHLDLIVFLRQLEDKGIKVSCDAREELEMTAKSCFTGMFMS